MTIKQRTIDLIFESSPSIVDQLVDFVTENHPGELFTDLTRSPMRRNENKVVVFTGLESSFDFLWNKEFEDSICKCKITVTKPIY